jgi:hypothetical protein
MNLVIIMSFLFTAPQGVSWAAGGLLWGRESRDLEQNISRNILSGKASSTVQKYLLGHLPLFLY